MNTARIVVLNIALGAGVVAAYLASGSDNKSALAEQVAQLQTVDVLAAPAVMTAQIELKPEQAETFARARPSGTLALRNIADVNITKNQIDNQAPWPGGSINVVRYGVAISMTTPNGPKGRPK